MHINWFQRERSEIQAAELEDRYMEIQEQMSRFARYVIAVWEIIANYLGLMIRELKFIFSLSQKHPPTPFSCPNLFL